MFTFLRFDRHAGLVRDMADTLGLDIDVEMQSGRLPPEDFRHFVHRCMGCQEPEACAQWLTARDGGAEAAPDYCRNKAELEARSA